MSNEHITEDHLRAALRSCDPVTIGALRPLWQYARQFAREAIEQCGKTHMVDELESALEKLVDMCNSDAALTNSYEVIHAEAVLERLHKARLATQKETTGT
jgi:hypothetical protein